jgi:hypothetical protein
MRAKLLFGTVAVAVIVVGAFVFRGGRQRPPASAANAPAKASAAGRAGGGDGQGRSDAPKGGETRAAPLAISRANGPAATWKLEDLQRVRVRKEVATEWGAASAWSLRDVAAALLDKGERISALSNAKGQTLTISAADWADESRLPLLRINHRGLWKFDWVDATALKAFSGGMRDVAGMAVSH